MFGAFAARCSGGVVAWFAHLPGSLSSLPCLLLLPLRFGPEDGDCPPRCAAPKCGGRRAVRDRPDRHAARCHIGLILTGAGMLVARYRTRQRGLRSHCHATLQILDPCSLHHPPATSIAWPHRFGHTHSTLVLFADAPLLTASASGPLGFSPAVAPAAWHERTHRR